MPLQPRSAFGSRVGESLAVRSFFSPGSSYDLLLTVEVDGFDPSSLDTSLAAVGDRLPQSSRAGPGSTSRDAARVCGDRLSPTLPGGEVLLLQLPPEPLRGAGEGG